MIKKIFLTTLSLFILLSVSCEDKSVKNDNNTINNIATTNNSNDNNSNDNDNTTDNDINKNKIIVTDSSEYINEKTDGTLYFYVSNANADGFDIIQEKFDNLSNLKSIVEREVELTSSIPKGTVINSVTVDNKIAYVDINNIFSEDPTTNSSAESRLKIYSIVNVLYYNKTLGIDKVKFLIDGEETETISTMSNEGFIGFGEIDSSSSSYDKNKFTPKNEEDAINEKTDGTIYFFISNDNADGFDIIKENVGTTDLKEVLDLAVSKLSIPTIPEGTVVNSAYVKDKIAYIDLNDFFASDSQTGSSASSYLKIYSVVNLAIYNKVFQADKVVLSIDGSTDGYIAQSDISEFYTEKLFNKGTN